MAKRRPGLGKGLDALIPSQQDDLPDSVSAAGILEVSLETISTNPHQPRRVFDPTKLEELAASIKEHGIIQPLVISEDEGKEDHYTLIAGERRLRAAKLAGLESVPVILRDADSENRLLVALIENVQRADLNPLETASAYQNLAVEFNLSHQEIGERVGKSRTAVTNILRLLDLPDVVQQSVRKGQISMGHARSLLALDTLEAQTAALQTILTKDLNVRQTEELVKNLKGTKTKKPPKKQGKSPELKALEEDLQSSLGTKVRLKQNKKGQGSITIHYYSTEEFNTLLDRLQEL